MTMTAEANPLAAVRTILRRDSDIAALTEGRFYVPELDGKDPRGNAQAMTRPCAVIRNTGGGSLGPGARSRAPWAVTRLDVESFGKTTLRVFPGSLDDLSGAGEHSKGPLSTTRS